MYCSSPNDELRYHKSQKKCLRQKLQNKFDKEYNKTTYPSTTTSENMERRSSERSILTSISNLSETKRVFRSGAEKITKTFNNMRTSIGSFSQVRMSCTLFFILGFSNNS